MDRIANLRIFLRLAETLNFSETAAAMNIARSSVSRIVAELEAELGARLIQRSTRKVALTPNGAAFQARCTAIIRDMDAMGAMFRPDQKGPKGRLRINAPTRLARRILAPALPDFLRQYPGIDLDFGATDRPVDLIAEGLDCVVRVGLQKDSGLVSRKVATLDMVNCASPDYLARHGTPRGPADLADHKGIGFLSPRTARDTGWTFQADDKIENVRMKPALRVTSAELYIASCVAGLGLIQVPAYDVRDLLANGSLVTVLPDHCAPAMPVAIVSTDRASLTPTIQVFTIWAAATIEHALRGDHAPPNLL